MWNILLKPSLLECPTSLELFILALKSGSLFEGYPTIKSKVPHIKMCCITTLNPFIRSLYRWYIIIYWVRVDLFEMRCLSESDPFLVHLLRFQLLYLQELVQKRR